MVKTVTWDSEGSREGFNGVILSFQRASKYEGVECEGSW